MMGDASGCALVGGGGLEVLLQAAEFVEQKPSAGADSSPSDRSLFDGMYCNNVFPALVYNPLPRFST